MISSEDLDALVDLASDEAQAGLLVRSAERVAQVEGVGIYIYSREAGHKKPHFHARFNGGESAVFSIDPFEIMPGTVSTLRSSQVRAVEKWAQGVVGDGEVADGNPPRPTRLQALLAAWEQAQSGARIVHIASRRIERPAAGSAAAVIAEIAPKVYSLMDPNPWRSFEDYFRIELLHHSREAGISAEQAKPHVDDLLKRIEEVIWETVKERTEPRASAGQ